jgi:hypothetical protein
MNSLYRQIRSVCKSLGSSPDLGPDSAFFGMNRIVRDLTFGRRVLDPSDDRRVWIACRRGRRRTAWADLDIFGKVLEEQVMYSNRH